MPSFLSTSLAGFANQLGALRGSTQSQSSSNSTDATSRAGARQGWSEQIASIKSSVGVSPGVAQQAATSQRLASVLFQAAHPTAVIGRSAAPNLRDVALSADFGKQASTYFSENGTLPLDGKAAKEAEKSVYARSDNGLGNFTMLETQKDRGKIMLASLASYVGQSGLSEQEKESFHGRIDVARKTLDGFDAVADAYAEKLKNSSKEVLGGRYSAWQGNMPSDVKQYHKVTKSLMSDLKSMVNDLSAKHPASTSGPVSWEKALFNIVVDGALKPAMMSTYGFQESDVLKHIDASKYLDFKNSCENCTQGQKDGFHMLGLLMEQAFDLYKDVPSPETDEPLPSVREDSDSEGEVASSSRPPDPKSTPVSTPEAGLASEVGADDVSAEKGGEATPDNRSVGGEQGAQGRSPSTVIYNVTIDNSTHDNSTHDYSTRDDSTSREHSVSQASPAAGAAAGSQLLVETESAELHVQSEDGIAGLSNGGNEQSGTSVSRQATPTPDITQEQPAVKGGLDRQNPVAGTPSAARQDSQPEHTASTSRMGAAHDTARSTSAASGATDREPVQASSTAPTGARAATSDRSSANIDLNAIGSPTSDQGDDVVDTKLGMPKTAESKPVEFSAEPRRVAGNTQLHVPEASRANAGDVLRSATIERPVDLSTQSRASTPEQSSISGRSSASSELEGMALRSRSTSGASTGLSGRSATESGRSSFMSSMIGEHPLTPVDAPNVARPEAASPKLASSEIPSEVRVPETAKTQQGVGSPFAAQVGMGSDNHDAVDGRIRAGHKSVPAGLSMDGGQSSAFSKPATVSRRGDNPSVQPVRGGTSGVPQATPAFAAAAGSVRVGTPATGPSPMTRAPEAKATGNASPGHLVGSNNVISRGTPSSQTAGAASPVRSGPANPVADPSSGSIGRTSEQKSATTKTLRADGQPQARRAFERSVFPDEAKPVARKKWEVNIPKALITSHRGAQFDMKFSNLRADPNPVFKKGEASVPLVTKEMLAAQKAKS